MNRVATSGKSPTELLQALPAWLAAKVRLVVLDIPEEIERTVSAWLHAREDISKLLSAGVRAVLFQLLADECG